MLLYSFLSNKKQKSHVIKQITITYTIINHYNTSAIYMYTIYLDIYYF